MYAKERFLDGEKKLKEWIYKKVTFLTSIYIAKVLRPNRESNPAFIRDRDVY